LINNIDRKSRSLISENKNAYNITLTARKEELYRSVKR
jgi:hypothetical protein